MSNHSTHKFEGDPYGAEVLVFDNGDEEETVTDLRVRIHPPCRLSESIIEDNVVGETTWTEYASTEKATVFDVEQVGPEGSHDDRAKRGLSTVVSVLETLNKIDNLSQDDF